MQPLNHWKILFYFHLMEKKNVVFRKKSYLSNTWQTFLFIFLEFSSFLPLYCTSFKVPPFKSFWSHTQEIQILPLFCPNNMIFPFHSVPSLKLYDLITSVDTLEYWYILVLLLLNNHWSPVWLLHAFLRFHISLCVK